ncbi:MAG: four helix bundle protein [Candidatus Roizmanbacteria bacterium]|nr:four helix bundle protein [Candidatus Roizmanbacteria bacterium]
MYDLESRTTTLGQNIVAFVKKLPRNQITDSLLIQLIRAGTSIGANYCEADGAMTKADFKNKITICRKEAKETRYWLRVVCSTYPGLENKTDLLIQEVRELIFIFSAILKK